MIIIAKGQLQHHFWGEYAATIALKFATEALALQSLPQLPGFERHSSVPSALIYHGTGDDLKNTEDLLVSLGANRKKLTSLAKSIDYGEPFTIEVNLTPEGPQAEQLSLLN